MSRHAFYYHADFLLHDTGSSHPERPQRLQSVMGSLIKSVVWSHLDHLMPAPAPLEPIYAVHPENYVAMIRRRCHAGDRILDEGDTHVCEHSYDVALLAVGAVLQAVDGVMSGSFHNAFCAVRPPGHHAETSTAMGFCLFNNVAIGARYAQHKYGIERVAIIDWDVHHGNGTQEIFYEDESVLYASLHQYPFYPGTGAASEKGKGKGEGTTVNCPLPAGSDEAAYAKAFETTIIPALDHFRPQLVMISAGFDAHRDDPLAQMQLTEESFAHFTRMIKHSAATHAQNRIVSVLEGGYNLEALARSVESHLSELAG
jgi:acetoin utilization deacetylase AcuC-like enzyme